jgi:aryl-alcohol dehydrogenase-like predicted oxidoreductase
LVSRLALGTAQFGLNYGIANQVGQISRMEAGAMLEIAEKNEIDTLDTAIVYGESETCLGEIGTQGFRLISKLPGLPDGCSDVGAWLKQQVAASLSRLGLTSIYGLLLHRPEQLIGHNGEVLYSALQSLKDYGLVQKVGVSVYAPSELSALMAKFNFDLIQAPFNLIDRRIYESGWLDRLKDIGVEVHTRSVFLQGLLLMPQADIPIKFMPWRDLLQKWSQWQIANNISALQACLAFPLSFPQIDRVVVGADSVRQLAEIIQAANVKINNTEPTLQCDDEQLINPAMWAKL